MEFKTLFYIVAVFLWLIFKYYEKQKELQSKRVTNVEPEILRKVQPNAAPIKQQQSSVKIVNKEFQADIVSFNDKVEENQLSQIAPEIIVNNAQKTEEDNSTLADDIRGGNVDWRKAILLSEILRPV